MEPLVLHRWRRYGKDRMYVNAPDGTSVAYHCMESGDTVILDPTRQAAARKLLEGWLVASGRPPMSKGYRADRAPAVAPSVPAPSAAGDLTLTAPGASLLEQLAERQQGRSRIRSWMYRLLDDGERALRLGARGEQLVGRQLRRLGDDWHVLHSIKVGDRGTDIDHLVIGPGGVFTLNAKHHRGKKIWVAGNTLMVDAYRQPYVYAARHEAAKVSKLLSGRLGRTVPVSALIVPVNADDVIVRQQPQGVNMVNRRRVKRWLRRQKPVLSSAEVEAIFDVASMPSTWGAGIRVHQT